MARKRKRNSTANKGSTTPATNQHATQTSPEAFAFGDPEPVLDNSMTNYLGVFLQDNGKYYEPPISLAGLAKVRRANAHHGAVSYFKRNMLLNYFVESQALDYKNLKRAGLDFVTLGNCYFRKIYDYLGQVVRLVHVPGINMRRMKERNRYLMLTSGGGQHEFDVDEIVHIKEYDLEQQIYGIPEYLGGLQSLLLNEDATIFRRKYYKNGAHTGYIFFTNDPNMSEKDEKNLKDQVSASKGAGNFRSLFVRIPKGDEHSIKIIPVGDVATKDEFERIKNISRNDIISAWRMNPALAGIMPENVGGHGDVTKISHIYVQNEIRPLAKQFEELNSFLRNDRKIRFDFPEVKESV